MLKKCLVFTTSLMLLAAVVLLAPSADSGKYQPVSGWPQLPAGMKLGPVSAVATDSADRVYVFHRGKRPILVFDKDGKFLRSWGDDLVKTAHGLRIDHDDNVWITDIGNHLVMKFDPDGKLLLTLGKKDQPGDGPDQFNKPTDVAVAPTGEFYVSDGYGNSRVVKFSKDGKYLKEWGKKGTGEGRVQPAARHLPGRQGPGLRRRPREQPRPGLRRRRQVPRPVEGERCAVWAVPGGRRPLAGGRRPGQRRAGCSTARARPLGRWGEKGAAAGAVRHAALDLHRLAGSGLRRRGERPARAEVRRARRTPSSAAPGSPSRSGTTVASSPTATPSPIRTIGQPSSGGASSGDRARMTCQGAAVRPTTVTISSRLAIRFSVPPKPTAILDGSVSRKFGMAAPRPTLRPLRPSASTATVSGVQADHHATACPAPGR